MNPPAPDFAVVIALKEEFRAVAEMLRGVWPYSPDVDSSESPEPDEGDNAVFSLSLPCAEGSVANGKILLINQAGPFNALQATERYLEKQRPRLLVNIGISGIISNDLRLGDVVVATDAVEYAANVKSVESTDFLDGLMPGNDWFPTSQHIWQEYARVDTRRETTFAFWQAAAVDSLYEALNAAERAELGEFGLTDRPPQIHHGKIATGPILSADAKLKKWLSERVDRKLLCIDQEAAEVLRATKGRSPIYTLVLRGISDGADPSKGALEQLSRGNIRKWALWNALSLFLSMMAETRFSNHAVSFTSPSQQADNADEVINRLHSLAVQSFLCLPYTLPPLCVHGSAYEAYSRLFEPIIGRPAGIGGDLFSETFSKLRSSQESVSFIDGPAGSGKTAFLSVFYWYLRRHYEEQPRDSTRPIPVFVSSSRIEQTSNGAETAKVLEQHFLQTLQRLLNQRVANPIWVLLDGVAYEERLLHAIKPVLWPDDNIAVGKQIVALRHLETEGRPDTILSFSSISLPSSGAEPIVDAFLQICSPTPKVEAKDRLLQALKGLQQGDLDLYILSKLYRTVYDNEGVPPNLPHFLRHHVRNRLSLSRETTPQAKESILEEVGAVAYQMCVAGSGASLIQAKPLIRRLLDEHHLILQYMAARYIISAYERAGSNDLDLKHPILGTVYPHYVNRFAKAILNRHDKEGRRRVVVSTIRRIVLSPKTSFTAKANACYLLGRVDGSQWKDQARKFLTTVRSLLEKKSPYLRPRDPDQLKQFLLFARTVHISLACCGDRDAETQYISLLLKDRSYDRINRGFHLEYYGDITYDLASPLVHLDELAPFPKTLKELTDRIRHGPINPLFNLEVQTLCSLALQRAVHGKLRQEDRVVITAVAESVANQVNSDLADYVQFVLRILRIDVSSFGDLALKYLDVKLLPRSGWVERGIATPETVGAHIYGAYLLGLLFLPDVTSDPIYDKTKILDMVLFHDLAEAIIGDLLPKEKTRDTIEQERQVMKGFAYWGTIEGAPPCSRIHDLWKEFESNETINAHVARDLDKLDNFFELYRLRLSGESVVDFSAFDDNLRSRIRTEVGHTILAYIANRFQEKAP